MSRFAGHKYTWTKPFTSVRHSWELRGPIGGIHFHASLSRNDEYEPSCGLEFHHCFDPSGGNQAPHHTNCHVTGGQCWHDGTSLYASEHIWPIVRDYLRGGEHAEVFRLLEREYEKHFEDFAGYRS